MSWHCLPELAEDCSERTCSDGGPSAPWKKSRTAEKCCSDANGTVCFPCSQSGTTSEHSTADRGVELWMSSLRGSRASRSRPQEENAGPTTKEICGQTLSESFAKWDRDGACWRTYQRCLLTNTLIPFSETWPRAGLIADGIAFRRPRSVPESFVTEFGLLHPPERWTSPTASIRGVSRDLRQRSDGGMRTLQSDLATMGERGPENPEWTEWLMGFPIGWTDVCRLEMPKFQQWCEQHGISCREQ